MKKKCPFPEDEDLVLFVYDKTLGRADLGKGQIKDRDVQVAAFLIFRLGAIYPAAPSYFW